VPKINFHHFRDSTLRGWQPPLENINSLVASGGPRLLARSRELVVTNGYAANACEAYAANLVGDGIKPSSLIEDGGLRDRVQRLWLNMVTCHGIFPPLGIRVRPKEGTDNEAKEIH